MWIPNTVLGQIFVVRMKWNWSHWCCGLPWWQMTSKPWCLRLRRENRSAWRICAPQMQPVLTWKWTQVFAVKSLIIITWALILTGYVALGETSKLVCPITNVVLTLKHAIRECKSITPFNYAPRLRSVLGVEVWLQAFVTAALDWGKWSASRASRSAAGNVLFVWNTMDVWMPETA